MIFKTMKWLLISGLAAGGLGYATFGTDLGSYLGTAVEDVQSGLQESIPVEFELKRAEKLIGEIEPEIQKCRKDLAQAEVELDELSRQVADLTEVVAAEEVQLTRLAAEAKARGEGLPRVRKLTLQRLFDSHRSNTAILSAKRKMIDRQGETVAAARQRLKAVWNERARLDDLVGYLKTQKAALDAQAVRSRIDLDDSALGEAREVLARVQKRLDVTQRMLDQEHLPDGSMADLDTGRDLLAEVESYLKDPEEWRGEVPAAVGLTTRR